MEPGEYAESENQDGVAQEELPMQRELGSSKTGGCVDCEPSQKNRCG